MILGFLKDFDKVAHGRLLNKLDHCGVHGQIWHWIKAWLVNREQSVIIDGVSSQGSWATSIFDLH